MAETLIAEEDWARIMRALELPSEALSRALTNTPWRLKEAALNMNDALAKMADERKKQVGQHGWRVQEPATPRGPGRLTELRALMRQLSAQMAEAERFPEDDSAFEVGTVLTWTRTFPSMINGVSEDKTYRYVAVKGGADRWYSSSAKSTMQVMGFDALCDFTEGEPVYIMTVGDRVIRGRNEPEEKLADVIGPEAAARVDAFLDDPSQGVRIERERPAED